MFYSCTSPMSSESSDTKAISVYIQRPMHKICIYFTATLVLKQSIRINIQQVTWHLEQLRCNGAFIVVQQQGAFNSPLIWAFAKFWSSHLFPKKLRTRSTVAKAVPKIWGESLWNPNHVTLMPQKPPRRKLFPNQCFCGAQVCTLVLMQV